MLMLSGAMVVGLLANGMASAGTQILDCYSPNGRVVACASDYGDAKAAMQSSHWFRKVVTRTTASGEEEVTVTGVRPDPDAIPTDVRPVVRSPRPGAGGDWVPVVATSPLDKLQQWQGEFLSGPGLLSGAHF